MQELQLPVKEQKSNVRIWKIKVSTYLEINVFIISCATFCWKMVCWMLCSVAWNCSYTSIIHSHWDIKSNHWWARLNIFVYIFWNLSLSCRSLKEHLYIFKESWFTLSINFCFDTKLSFWHVSHCSQNGKLKLKKWNTYIKLELDQISPHWPSS